MRNGAKGKISKLKEARVGSGQRDPAAFPSFPFTFMTFTERQVREEQVDKRGNRPDALQDIVSQVCWI